MPIELPMFMSTLILEPKSLNRSKGTFACMISTWIKSSVGATGRKLLMIQLANGKGHTMLDEDVLYLVQIEEGIFCWYHFVRQIIQYQAHVRIRPLAGQARY